MSAFEDFSEMLERTCFNGWRSVIGRGDEALLSEISTVIYTKEDRGSEWAFSFGLRRFGRWAQCQRQIEPVDFDPLDLPPADRFDPKKSMSPMNKASALGIEMISEVAERLGSDAG